MNRTEHVLKVQPPYFEAVLDGSKTFEVRRNDRAYQRGDVLVLWEFPGKSFSCQAFPCSTCNPRSIRREVSFVYSSDPRFGGVEPGFVVLGLSPVSGE